MNTSTKCNCCICEKVCAYKKIYEDGVKSILNTTISNEKNGFWKLRDCPHIEVSIRCPHMVTGTQIRNLKGGDTE